MSDVALELVDRRCLFVADLVRRAEDRGGDRAADVDVETAVTTLPVDAREAGHPGRHAADERAPLPDARHPPLRRRRVLSRKDSHSNGGKDRTAVVPARPEQRHGASAATRRSVLLTSHFAGVTVLLIPSRRDPAFYYRFVSAGDRSRTTFHSPKEIPHEQERLVFTNRGPRVRPARGGFADRPACRSGSGRNRRHRRGRHRRRRHRSERARGWRLGDCRNQGYADPADQERRHRRPGAVSGAGPAEGKLRRLGPRLRTRRFAESEGDAGQEA